jgi:hypothetical protein
MRKVIVFAPLALIAAPISGRIQAAPSTKVKTRAEATAEQKERTGMRSHMKKWTGCVMCGPSVMRQS